MAQVNLDALIKREDLFKSESEVGEKNIEDFTRLKIGSDLIGTSFFFKTLRKADFQRVTSEWKPERVHGLIKSFIKGDIIPACILWNWNGFNFIIDGGHRLSALIAWIEDDYGDGAVSIPYFGSENITDAQKRNAKKTRDLIDNDPEIGAFKKLTHALNNSKDVPPDEFKRASDIINQRNIQAQYIKANSSEEAEMSFFRINGEATPIDETETIILKSRKKPNGIAARAILHGGSAHKYWKGFKDDTRKEIEETAIATNKYLFDPPLDPATTKFPCAGDRYSNQSLEIVFGIVNMINELDEINSKRGGFLKKEANEIPPKSDETGEDTLHYLTKVKRIISIVSGTAKQPISLGLSSVIYFYSPRGRFQITAFLAMVHIALQWDKEREEKKSDIFQRFCAIRGQFEDFLLSNKGFITEATINIGSGIKSYKRLADLFLFIINGFFLNNTKEEIIEKIQANDNFSFIKVYKAENEFAENRNKPGRKIPPETRNQIIIKEYLNARILCPYCGGHRTFESYNIDHIKELRNKGDSSLENLALVHVYCNQEKDLIKKYTDDRILLASKATS